MFDMKTNFFYKLEAPILSLNDYLATWEKGCLWLSGIADENQR